MSMENKDYGNILCEAVDTIITQRLQGLSYDQTILCTIVDDSRREQGIYIATNDSARFEVVSDQTNYRNGNNVYVLIPKGDWNETKTITGKKNIKDSEISYTYKNPFDYLVDVTNNLIENYTQNPAGLIANSEEEICEIWQKTFSEGEAGYTRLGLNAQFRSWLNPFYAENDTTPRKIIQGSYGLKLTITTVSDNITNGSKEATYELYIDAEDMNGNPYDFNTYFQQEKVFDISNLGKITFIKLEFYQKPGTFVDVEGKAISPTDFLGNPTADNLFVKDAYISLGYDVRDFENDDVILYTTNNTTYIATAENKEKSVHLRWIHDFGNNTEGKSGLCVVEDSDLKSLGAEIKWYQYEFGRQSADKYSGVYWKYTNENANNLFEYNFIPNFTKAEEKIKAIVFYNNKYIPSNIIAFSNEKEVPNQATIDIVSAIGINCEDGTYGNYRIYNLGNSLFNLKEGSTERNFQVTFGGSVLTEAERIEWIIPAKNSMIIIDNVEPREDGFYHIIKEITDGEVSKEEAQQKYRIRNYYSQNYNRNTITCKVTKDGVEYSGSKELTFGPAGTTGTDVTFVLDFDNGITALTTGNTDAITVTARLYDYENKEVDLSAYSIEWSILNQNQIAYNVIKSPYQVELQLTSNNLSMTSNYNILQAKLTNFGDFELIAYLPLPIRRNTNYKYISGTTSLIYNSSGYLDNFYWNPYTLYYTQDADSNILESYSDWGISVQNSTYGPTLDDYTDKDKNIKCYRLKPTSIYVDDGTNTGVCIYCTLNGTIVWSQPILITQNRYPAAILNKWNGELSLGGEDGNTIMSARVVAGSKDDYNRFSGVMMGDWKGKDATTDITSNTGIYGFYQGSASFGFRDNGTAFIGKVGEGRIEFDGTKAQITTNRYADGYGGMSLDFDDGKIEVKSPNTNITAEIEGNIIIDSTQSRTPFKIGSNFSVNWDGTIKATDGNFSGTIDADEGYIGGWTINENNISGGSTTLYSDGRIEAGGNFSVSTSGQLTAKSADITGTIDATTGYLRNLTVTGKLTSSSGSLDFGDGFKVSKTGVLSAEGAIISGTITAEEGSIGGWAIGKSTLTGGSVTLNSAGEIKAPNITVVNGATDIGTLGSYQGSDGTSSTTVIGINASSNSVVLQSGKYVRLSANTGMKLESEGEIVCSGTKFSMNQMTSLALPATVMSASGSTLFTINGSTMAFSCTTTGIYATLK